MEIESLGDAWEAGYRLRTKCAWGKRRDGLKSIRACSFEYELDVSTLLWTSGRPFPVVDNPIERSRHEKKRWNGSDSL